MHRRSLVAALLAFAACPGPGGDAETTRPAEVARAPRELPPQGDARDAVVARFGERLFAALAAGAPGDLLYDDEAVAVLLTPESATRVRALRATRVDADPAQLRRFAETEYLGVCLQGARHEPAHGSVGAVAPTWVVGRALVVGRKPNGQRLGAWVEGTFVYSNVGFGAVDLRRVESPRWEHSDLEIATCELSVGLHDPAIH